MDEDEKSLKPPPKKRLNHLNWLTGHQKSAPPAISDLIFQRPSRSTWNLQCRRLSVGYASMDQKHDDACRPY